ncbi:DNA polymerase [Allokutzneria sp. A3M-2-11 16]|uniref:DNA polymerase n=1 Tax=Allokutzneria sp. A3M-2-11 16 TaxID=2962043 RepID=UPI0020B75D03|nr:DNA polymerase [Allokutzneria sp. A3M-2-11 16]MCP3800213.1 DNA polymerase [Allokutzneria sp. A3M-2-11 16]
MAGEATTIRVVETREDVEAFTAWTETVRSRVVAFDTETTSTDIYAPGFRLRLAQFGTETDAWVIPVDAHQVPEPRRSLAARAVVDMLNDHPRLTVHNATFDALIAARHLGVDLDSLWSRVTDTTILAHLCDPRGPEDGGTGMSLKALAAQRVDSDAPDTATGLYAAFREIGHTKDTGWAAIDLHHPLYTLYAGLDVILGARLYHSLSAEAAVRGFGRLAEFEHAVALVCAKIEARGFRVDPGYLSELSIRLAGEATQWGGVAAEFGVTSVNAPAQVSAALVGMGETLTETTDTGALKVDKEVLKPLADLDRDWERVGAREPNLLAEAVLRAKRAAKWRVSYADAMLSRRDADDRIHPSITALKARTARMSISRPPLQQLPSGDWVIRRALVADFPGWVVGGVDYAAVEMRILAALSGDPVMCQAIHDGHDLHDYTAELIFGPAFTKGHRKIAKGVGFGKVYGGGPDTLARQTGAPLEQVRATLREYDRVYRGIKRYSRRLVQRAEYGCREVITPAGRVLPLDRRRLYAAVNYMVQSTARDVLAEALLRLDERGLTPYLRLPVHDEVVWTAPADIAADVGREIADAMTVPDFFGVPLFTDLEIGGYSWGSLYGAPL